MGGRHALALSLRDGSWLRRAADEAYPAASVIKLPLLVLALREAEAGRLDLSERRTLPRADAAGGSGVLRYLADGLAPTWRDLLTLMVIVSDNTATNVVLERLGVDAVNAALPRMGMPATRVVGPLQVATERRTPAQRAGETARTTAADVHALLEALDDGRLLSPAGTAWARETLVAQQLRHGVPRRITGDEPRYDGVAVGSKSGSLHAARHDAGVVWRDDGARLAIVVALTADVPDGRFRLDHPATLATARLAADALALARG